MTRRHGLGKAGVEALLADQNGGCAICGVPYEDKPGSRLAMDHNHEHCPGKKGCAQCVRGMLCLYCNNMLRSAKDNPAMLRKAAAYLEHHGSTQPYYCGGAQNGQPKPHNACNCTILGSTQP